LVNIQQPLLLSVDLRERAYELKEKFIVLLDKSLAVIFHYGTSKD